MKIGERKNEKLLSKEEQKNLIETEKKQIKELSHKLDRHTERNKNTNHINYKINYLLHDPFTFVNAYTKISKNKRALTKGYKDNNDIEYFGLEKAKIIAKKIKNETYEFKPVKRTWIPKLGKKKKRPVDVPPQSDRIVQEAIKEILEAIYEPVFKKWGKETENLSNNYGFRPKHSAWMAVEKLERYSRRCTTIIEGDIVSAYNNVDHNILLKILEQRIKDKKFLKLIKKMLKNGIMDHKTFEHSLTGTPQGGIVSPLLFNIYMLGFDEYVYNKFIVPVLIENEKKKLDAESPAYSRIKYHTNKALKELKKTKKKNYKTQEFKTAQKRFRELRAIRNKTPFEDVRKLKKGAVYVRYADGWVLALTCKKKEAKQIKNTISEFLQTHRKMQLDEEKTKITHASEGYKFLGFEIRLNIKKPKLARVLQKNSKGNFTRTLKRTTSRQLTIEPDSNRILKKLKLLKFCNENYEPRGRPAWTVYNEFQIVQKYSQVFRGIFNYYEPCDRLTRLYRISYILQYSCAKTLARRKKVSMKQIFIKYGKNLFVETKIQGTKETKIRTIEFTDLSNLRKRKQKKKFIVPIDQDPFRIAKHWRTKFKIYNKCCICGTTDTIALHHINSVSSLKNRDKYENIRATINRFQIPVCKKCHEDIAHGRYDNPKTPIEFYDEFLAKL
jgi:group II intron reverse transcriptase/maturase